MHVYVCILLCVHVEAKTDVSCLHQLLSVLVRVAVNSDKTL